MNTSDVPGNQSSDGDDYQQLFSEFVAQSVSATLALFDPAAVALTAEERDRLLHVLSYALHLDAAWAETRILLLQVAPKMEQAGHRDDWIPYLASGVDLSRQQHDRLAEAELSLYIGELFRLLSKFDLARVWLDGSIAGFTALGANQGQARALNQLAFVAWQQHYYAEAAALAQTALTLLDENDPERATCFSRLGLVAIDRQQWEEAERYHRDALQICQVQGDQRKFAWSLQNLGYALRGQSRYIEAIDCYQQAITILEAVQDLANCATVQMNLGIVYSLDGRPAEALKLYAQAEHTFRQQHNTHNLAKVLVSKGIDALALQDWMQAENAFATSAVLFQEIGDVSLRLDALDGLGLVYLGQGQHERAMMIFTVVAAELPHITGTYTYEHLVKVLPMQIAETKQMGGRQDIGGN